LVNRINKYSTTPISTNRRNIPPKTTPIKVFKDRLKDQLIETNPNKKMKRLTKYPSTISLNLLILSINWDRIKIRTNTTRLIPISSRRNFFQLKFINSV
jgi:hypothetical protein